MPSNENQFFLFVRFSKKRERSDAFLFLSEFMLKENNPNDRKIETIVQMKTVKLKMNDVKNEHKEKISRNEEK